MLRPHSSFFIHISRKPSLLDVNLPACGWLQLAISSIVVSSNYTTRSFLCWKLPQSPFSNCSFRGQC